MRSFRRSLLVTSAMSIVIAPPIRAQRLTIEPRVALVDELVRIAATGLAPGQPVIVRATRVDSAGHRWQSFAGLRADKGGIVDLSKQPPANGSYIGVQPMGLFTSMDVGGDGRGRERYPYRWQDTLRTVVTLEADRRVIATDTVVQTFLTAGVRSHAVRDSGLVGTLFVGGSGGTHASVLVLGGSEGGLSGEDVAAQLASHGYSALALAYFGVDSLPTALDQIPIEYFGRALRYLARQPGAQAGALSILATSKGAEAALVVASRYPAVRAVVAYAPSSVVWSCICGAAHSSWTWEGKDLPSVPAATDPTYQPPQGFPIRPAINYRFRMTNAAVRAAAAIPVERITAPLLLVAGDADDLWPSSAMARQIMDRRKYAGVGAHDVFLHYADAGHLIGKAYLPVGTTVVGGGRLETGGTASGDAIAQGDAWPRVLEFLRRQSR